MGDRSWFRHPCKCVCGGVGMKERRAWRVPDNGHDVCHRRIPSSPVGISMEQFQTVLLMPYWSQSAIIPLRRNVIPNRAIYHSQLCTQIIGGTWAESDAHPQSVPWLLVHVKQPNQTTQITRTVAAALQGFGRRSENRWAELVSRKRIRNCLAWEDTMELGANLGNAPACLPTPSPGRPWVNIWGFFPSANIPDNKRPRAMLDVGIHPIREATPRAPFRRQGPFIMRKSE